MPEVGAVEIGQPSGGGGIGGLSPRVLLIGAGVIAVAGILLWQQRSSGGTATAEEPGLSGSAVAIGSLESRLKETAGRHEEQLADLSSSLGGQISAASSAYGTQLGALSETLSGQIAGVGSGLGGQLGALETSWLDRLAGLSGGIGGLSSQLSNVQTGLSSQTGELTGLRDYVYSAFGQQSQTLQSLSPIRDDLFRIRDLLFGEIQAWQRDVNAQMTSGNDLGNGSGSQFQ